MRKYLRKSVQVIVDRPLGTVDPNTNRELPINIGTLPGTVTIDNSEVNAYILGVSKPLTFFSGTVIALVQRSNHPSTEIVVASEQAVFEKENIQEQLNALYPDQYISVVMA
ncbi:inorganic pyrophosphatase [Texcoconibacillus texcoconensis]|uniref:Inorganic pyrophosphatase n=1 Tax=Texcoconibacillus texcoconensis TaxID=1095777 RepID=A0A840QPQ5_9BACI|nr:inorganic pyrophosphatase [Texcoconibacillus texcoconensis]MBB5173303.1 inorganic pyrophosphatase [Texcoconibacillus texcoconensis]